MSPNEVRSLRDREIVELLVNLRPSDEAVAWLSSVITDPVKVAGVMELSRRYAVDTRTTPPSVTDHGKHPVATSVRIDPSAFKSFFYRRMLPLTEVGPLFGRCSGWASVICHKAQVGYWAADELATELGMHVNDFLSEVCVPEELERLSLV